MLLHLITQLILLKIFSTFVLNCLCFLYNLKIVLYILLDPAKYEVQLKIDNLNVEDMFDSERQERLLEIFRRKLWPDSSDDIYLTFLASAVQLGARLPLRPTEGEG